jgi:hypothetical protein
VTGIADTGFLVAFANRKDRHHRWAVELAARIDDALLTCDAMLAQTAFHLENVPCCPACSYLIIFPGWLSSRSVTRTANPTSPIFASSGSAN